MSLLVLIIVLILLFGGGGGIGWYGQRNSWGSGQYGFPLLTLLIIVVLIVYLT